MPEFFFVQIGAADGIAGDPLRPFILKYHWKGIFVEPVTQLFHRLIDHYREKDGFIFENVAISEREEVRDFYRIENKEELPYWCQGLGSFFPEAVLKHTKKIPNLKDYLIVEKVHCIPLRNLFKKHHVTRIDLLQTDTEGYDSEILKQVDFGLLRPKIIRYESRHLTEEAQKDCLRLLRQHGYTVVEEPYDTFAFLNSGRIRLQIHGYRFSHMLQKTFHALKKILHE